MIEQRTPEWYEARKHRVTGSNVGAILGLSPFMKPKDVMRKMVRDYQNAPSEFTGNAATDYGTFHERIAKMDYELEYNQTITEVGFYTYEDWLGASPDGFLDNETLIEIKCPYGQRDKNPPVFKHLYEQPHYYSQMQIQMFVTNTIACKFYQWSPHGQSLWHVSLMPFWIEENLPKLKTFYDEYLIERELPNAQKYLDDKHVKVTYLNDYVAEYLSLKDQIDALEAKRKDLLSTIVSACDEKDSVIYGHKLTKVTRAGAVSYAKAIKELCPDADLTKYTGKPTEYWKLS